MTVNGLAMRRMALPVQRALRNDFVRHSALVFGATMAANVLNYLFNFALSRRLGVEGFATLSSLVSFLMILSIPTSVLTLVVVKYSAVFHAAGDAGRVRRLSQVLLKWTGIAGIIALALGLLLRAEIASFLRIPNDIAIVLALGIIALGLMTPSVRGILQGEQDFLRYSISAVLEASIKVLLAIALVYAGFGVRGAMFGWIVGTACALAYTIGAVLRKHGSAAALPVPLSLDLRRLMQTTAGVGLATGFLTFISFMDVLLVKHYFEPRQAGLYAAVNLSGKIVLFLAAFIPAVVLPKAVGKSTSGENPLPMLAQAGSVTLLLLGGALAIFACMPAEVLRFVAGGAFAAAAPFVFPYGCAMGMLAVLTLLVNYKIGLHQFDFLYMLGAVVLGEVLAIAFYHRTLWDVIHVLLIGNAIAVAGCLYGVAIRTKAARTAAPEAA